MVKERISTLDVKRRKNAGEKTELAALEVERVQIVNELSKLGVAEEEEEVEEGEQQDDIEG